MVGEIDETATDATKAETRYTVYAKQWVAHPNYDNTNFAKDIGLVYLPSDVYQSKNVDIAPLYLHDPQISSHFTSHFLDQSAKVAGFGRKGESGAYSNTLQVTTVKFVAFSRCQSDYTNFAPDSSSICYTSASTTQVQVICICKSIYQTKIF
jgi:hypothetical protein